MKTGSVVSILIWGSLLFCMSSFAAEKIVDEKIGIKLLLPDGFEYSPMATPLGVESLAFIKRKGSQIKIFRTIWTGVKHTEQDAIATAAKRMIEQYKRRRSAIVSNVTWDLKRMDSPISGSDGSWLIELQGFDTNGTTIDKGKVVFARRGKEVVSVVYIDIANSFDENSKAFDTILNSLQITDRTRSSNTKPYAEYGIFSMVVTIISLLLIGVYLKYGRKKR